MSRPLRILIVEDEPRWARAIKSNLLEILNDLNLPCTIAAPESISECKTAIRSAGENPYDLVSLDINLREDGAEEPTDGLKLLGIIGQFQSAWLVSILTGVEADTRVEDAYGAERARQLQEELRSRAYASFPPERLVVLEKPALDDQAKLAGRVRQICLILRQTLAGRNLFRPLELPCQVAVHRTIDGDLIKRDSEEFRRAERAMKFVKEYEKDPSASRDPDRRKQYETERKLDILEKVGKSKKLRNADWVDDAVSLRQVRFGCGEVITLTDTPYFETIAWLLRHPWEEFAAHEIGGDAADTRRLSVDFEHSFEDEEIGGGGDEDDDMNRDRRGEDRDFETGEGGESPAEWDSTEAESHAAYWKELKRKKAELKSAAGSRREELGKEIEALQHALGVVRKKSVGGKSHESIKQHKSRAIGALKEAGQVELANHLEKTIRIEEGKFSYHIEPDTISGTPIDVNLCELTEFEYSFHATLLEDRVFIHMPDTIPDDWLVDPPTILVAGDGTFAAALAAVLAAGRIGTTALIEGLDERTGEQIPHVLGELELVFLVGDPGMAAAEILALHREVWEWVERLSPQQDEHRLAVLFVLPDRGDRLEASLALGLGRKDINPEICGHAVVRMSDPLQSLLATAARTVPRDAVVLRNRIRADERHEVLRGLKNATSDDSAAQHKAARNVLRTFHKREYDLDVFCRRPCHSNGNDLRKALHRAVTQTVTPNEWNEMLAKLS